MASLIFNWKRVEAESRILKQSSEHRERQFSKPLKCLKIWEALSRMLSRMLLENFSTITLPPIPVRVLLGRTIVCILNYRT